MGQLLAGHRRISRDEQPFLSAGKCYQNEAPWTASVVGQRILAIVEALERTHNNNVHGYTSEYGFDRSTGRFVPSITLPSAVINSTWRKMTTGQLESSPFNKPLHDI